MIDGTIDTGYLDRHLEEFLPRPQLDDALLLAAATARLLWQEASAREHAIASSDVTSPWALTDGWRLGHAGKRVIALQHRDERIEFSASGSNGDYRITRDGQITHVTGARSKATVLSARFDSVARRFTAQVDETRVLVHDGIQRMRLEIVPVYQRQASAQGSDERRLQAPMPGRVVLVKVQPGDQVIAGQEVLVIEAMKMELGLKAPRDGVIAEVRAQAGDFVEADAVLVTLDP